MLEPIDITQETYDTMAERWTTSYEQEDPFWKTEIKTFKRLLPTGHILEIGAGGGRDAEQFLALGYEYTGVDNSSGMLRAAKKMHPKVRFLRRDVRNLRIPKGTQFDGFWAAAILLHLPKSHIDVALQQIHNVIRAGGIGLITLREGQGEGLRERVKHNLPDKRYFAHYTKEEFAAILARHNFKVIKISSRPEDEYMWLSFFVQVL